VPSNEHKPEEIMKSTRRLSEHLHTRQAWQITKYTVRQTIPKR